MTEAGANHIAEVYAAYQKGLTAFVAACEKIDPKDAACFQPVLKLALRHFGMTGKALAERLGHSKGTISKWVNLGMMPAQSDREIAHRWIIEQAKKQLAHLPTQEP